VIEIRRTDAVVANDGTPAAPPVRWAVLDVENPHQPGRFVITLQATDPTVDLPRLQAASQRGIEAVREALSDTRRRFLAGDGAASFRRAKADLEACERELLIVTGNVDRLYSQVRGELAGGGDAAQLVEAERRLQEAEADLRRLQGRKSMLADRLGHERLQAEAALRRVLGAEKDRLARQAGADREKAFDELAKVAGAALLPTLEAHWRLFEANREPDGRLDDPPPPPAPGGWKPHQPFPENRPPTLEMLTQRGA
jgi:hypothetical protein